jgi:hypothetical protein
LLTTLIPTAHDINGGARDAVTVCGVEPVLSAGVGGSVPFGTRPSSLIDRVERQATPGLLTVPAGGATAEGSTCPVENAATPPVPGWDPCWLVAVCVAQASMVLPHPRWAEQHNVGFGFDEGEGGQVSDLAGVKVGWSVQLHLK